MLFHYYIAILILDYQYINLRLSIIFGLSSEDIYLSLSISSSFVPELYCGEVFETLVILSAILFPIKSPVASAVFWIAVFEAVLSASVAACLAWSRSSWLYLLSKFYLYFYQYFFPYFWQKTKIHSLLKILDFGWIEYRVIFYMLYFN